MVRHSRLRRGLAVLAGLLLASACGAAPAADLPADGQVPRYAHIVVVLDENKNYDQILNPAAAPEISALAKT